jgi:hypothetical protein
MVDSNFRVFYDLDQNESKHYLSLSTYGAGPLTEDGRWVLINKVGEAAAGMGEAESVVDEFIFDDGGIPGGDDLPETEEAEGMGEGSAEGLI